MIACPFDAAAGRGFPLSCGFDQECRSLSLPWPREVEVDVATRVAPHHRNPLRGVLDAVYGKQRENRARSRSTPASASALNT
jgi:hypothetical protein